MTLILLFGAAIVFPQDRIKPDRPDFTEGTDIMSKGRIQVESGLVRSKSGRLWSSSWAETTFRYGLDKRNELRLELPTATWARKAQNYENGAIGLKYAVPSSDDAPLTFALIGSFTVPSGNAGLGWQPMAMIAAGYEVTEGYGFGAGIGWEREADDEGVAGQWFASLALEASLGAKWDGYLEWFGLFGHSKGEPNRNLANAGLIYYAKDDLALDVSFGKWLQRHNHYYFGLGASWRW